jgi:hypothetical protein
LVVTLVKVTVRLNQKVVKLQRLQLQRLKK